jgi:hypothetical protein
MTIIIFADFSLKNKTFQNTKYAIKILKAINSSLAI